MKNERNTIPKITEKNSDIGKTDFAEIYGRQLSKMEGCCHVFLSSACDLKALDDGSSEISGMLKLPCTDKELSLKNFQEIKYILAAEILDAILKRDISALKSLVKFVKKWEYLKSPVDPERFEILLLKKRCELSESKMTAVQVARYLNRRYEKHYDTKTSESLSALRKRLKRVGFPLADGTKGRPKKLGQIRNKISASAV